MKPDNCDFDQNDSLRMELNAVKQEREAVSAALSVSEKALEELKTENDKLVQQLESHAWEVSPVMAQSKLDELNREVQRLKSENARLPAALKELRDTDHAPECETGADCHLCNTVQSVLDGDRTPLRDLLAPAIELFEDLSRSNCVVLPKEYQRDVDKELARLRAACGEKKK